jgi:hypothetical protein
MKFKYLRAIASEGTVMWISIHGDNTPQTDLDAFLEERGAEGWGWSPSRRWKPRGGA